MGYLQQAGPRCRLFTTSNNLNNAFLVTCHFVKYSEYSVWKDSKENLPGQKRGMTWSTFSGSRAGILILSSLLSEWLTWDYCAAVGVKLSINSPRADSLKFWGKKYKYTNWNVFKHVSFFLFLIQCLSKSIIPWSSRPVVWN